MSKKNGMAIVDMLLVFGTGAIIVAIALFGFARNHVLGNKQIIDMNYKFNAAYVLEDNGKFERVEIKAWKDWKDSDAVQVITKDGKAIYTHLRNVKLVHE